MSPWTEPKRCMRGSSGSICRIRHIKAITVSAGVAISPDHGSSGKEVIQAADAALYQAKEAGRDLVVVADSRFKGMALAN